MFWSNQSKKNLTLVIIFIILSSLPSIFSLFHSGFFPTDDGEWMVIRFSAFHQALVDGQFPVRWLGRLNHQYGYPVANFLYPGFMYLAEVPKVLGFGFVDSIKTIIGLSMVGSAVFAYLWLSRLFGNLPSFVGALFYLYAPYHLYDLYKRGSVGEILALAVVPFIFWSIERKSFFWTALGIALLILSHNTLALLFLPIIIVYGFLRKVFSIKYYVLSIILGLSMSSFFWIPAIFDLQYTRFFQTQVANWQDYFVRIELIGFSSFAVLVLSIPFVLHHYDTRKYRSVVLFIVLGFVSVFLSLPISSVVWQLLPVSLIQFPFRFLSVSLLAVTFLSAFIIAQSRSNLKALISIILLVFLAFSATQFSRPAVQFDKGDHYYATNEGTTTVQNEYLPEWVKAVPVERASNKVEIINGKGEVNNSFIKNNKIEFQLEAQEDALIRINTIYFPGWKAFIDGKESPISFNNDKGVMDIVVPKGEHNVKFVFGETPIRLVADAISLLSFLTLLGLVWKTRGVMV